MVFLDPNQLKYIEPVANIFENRFPDHQLGPVRWGIAVFVFYDLNNG